MVATDRVLDILVDAFAVHDSSLEKLAVGDVRKAAERAWEATKLATTALLLARFSKEPDQTIEISKELNRLAEADARAEILVDRYYLNLGYLYEECSRLGLCEPVEAAEQYIRETANYIRDAEKLAYTEP